MLGKFTDTGLVILDGSELLRAGDFNICALTHPDCPEESLRRAAESHGSGFPRHLASRFAIALSEGPHWALWRDPSGTYPLYYGTAESGGVYFSDRIAPLLLYLPTPSLNEETLIDYLSFMWTMGEKTFFQGISMVPPGGSVSNTGVDTFFAFEHRESEEPAEGWEECIRETLRECVSGCLSNDAGCHLSGGVDSSAVFALATLQRGSPLPAYVASFPDHPEYDESPYGVEVAKKYKGELKQAVIRPQDIEQHLRRLLTTLEEPKCHPPVLARLILEDAMERDGLTTILTGRGADELFTGYASHTVAGLKNPFERRTVFEPGACRSLLKRDVAYDVRSAFEARFAQNSSESRLERAMTFDFGTLMANWMTIDYKVSAARGARCIAPFLDRRMIELALRIPVSRKCPNGDPKALLKRAVSELLPESVLTRPKVGFRTPMTEMLHDGLEAYVRDTLHPGTSAFWDWFRHRSVESLLKRHFSEDANLGWQVWALLSLREWFRIYIDDRSWAR